MHKTPVPVLKPNRPPPIPPRRSRRRQPKPQQPVPEDAPVAASATLPPVVPTAPPVSTVDAAQLSLACLNLQRIRNELCQAVTLAQKLVVNPLLRFQVATELLTAWEVVLSIIDICSNSLDTALLVTPVDRDMAVAAVLQHRLLAYEPLLARWLSSAPGAQITIATQNSGFAQELYTGLSRVLGEGLADPSVVISIPLHWVLNLLGWAGTPSCKAAFPRSSTWLCQFGERLHTRSYQFLFHSIYLHYTTSLRAATGSVFQSALPAINQADSRRFLQQGPEIKAPDLPGPDQVDWLHQEATASHRGFGLGSLPLDQVPTVLGEVVVWFEPNTQPTLEQGGPGGGSSLWGRMNSGKQRKRSRGLQRLGLPDSLVRLVLVVWPRCLALVHPMCLTLCMAESLHPRPSQWIGDDSWTLRHQTAEPPATVDINPEEPLAAVTPHKQQVELAVLNHDLRLAEASPGQEEDGRLLLVNLPDNWTMSITPIATQATLVSSLVAWRRGLRTALGGGAEVLSPGGFATTTSVQPPPPPSADNNLSASNHTPKAAAPPVMFDWSGFADSPEPSPLPVPSGRPKEPKSPQPAGGAVEDDEADFLDFALISPPEVSQPPPCQRPPHRPPPPPPAPLRPVGRRVPNVPKSPPPAAAESALRMHPRPRPSQPPPARPRPVPPVTLPAPRPRQQDSSRQPHPLANPAIKRELTQHSLLLRDVGRAKSPVHSRPAWAATGVQSMGGLGQVMATLQRGSTQTRRLVCEPEDDNDDGSEDSDWETEGR